MSPRVRTGYEFGRRRLVWRRHPRRQPRLYRGVRLLHAASDGHAVPLGGSSWRTVCGVLVGVGRWTVAVQFRRFLS